jgi:hypothetical protein
MAAGGAGGGAAFFLNMQPDGASASIKTAIARSLIR